MAEYEDWGSARIAQLEQEDLERYRRDVLRNSSYSYVDATPNYVDEFQSKLSVLIDLVRGLSSDLKRTSSIENGLEPPTMNLHSSAGHETTDKLHSDEDLVVNEFPDLEEMLVFDDTKGIVSSSSEAVPDLEESAINSHSSVSKGFKVLSIYYAHMTPKWNNILEMRPKQSNDMSVEVYYDLFYSWKKKLDAVNYIGGEESYIDDFIHGLEIKLGMRVWAYKWKPRTLYGAFRRAEIEEILMKNDAEMVLEEMPRLNSSDIQGVENVSYVYTNVELDSSLGIEFTIKASLLEKDNEPIQLLLQKPVGHNEGNVVDGGVDLQAALGSLGGTTINASSNGSAKYWLEGASLFIEVVFGHSALKKDASTMINEMPADAINEHLIAPYIKGVDGLLMFIFDPGINSLFDEMFQSFQVAKLEEQVIHLYAPHDVKLIMLALSDPGGSRIGVVCSSRRDNYPLIGKSHVMYVFGFKGARHANAFSNTWEILCLSGSSFVGNEWGLKDLKAHIQMVLIYRFLGKCYNIYPLNDILMFVFDLGVCFLRCMDCDILEHNGEQGDFHFTTIIVDAPECCYYAFDEDPAKGISIFLVMGIEFEKWHSHLVVENCCRLFDPGGCCLFYNGCVYSEFNVYQEDCCLDTIMVVLRLKSNPQTLDPRTSANKDQLNKNRDQRNVYGSLLFMSATFAITLSLSWYKESITVRHVIFIERKCGLYALDGRMQACATEFGLCAIWIHIFEDKDGFEGDELSAKLIMFNDVSIFELHRHVDEAGCGHVALVFLSPLSKSEMCLVPGLPNLLHRENITHSMAYFEAESYNTLRQITPKEGTSINRYSNFCILADVFEWTNPWLCQDPDPYIWMLMVSVMENKMKLFLTKFKGCREAIKRDRVWDQGQNVLLYILVHKVVFCWDMMEDFGLSIVHVGLYTSRLGKIELGLTASDLKHFKQYSDWHGYDDVFIATLQNLVWDPGQNFISFYILEGKDVFERMGKWIIRKDHITELRLTMPMFVSPREDHLGVSISQSAGNVAFLISLSSQRGISTKDSETIKEKGVLPSTSLQTLSRRELLIFYYVSLHYLLSVSATTASIRSINNVREMKGRMLYDMRVFSESQQLPFCCHIVSFLNPGCVFCCFSLVLSLVGDLAYTNAMQCSGWLEIWHVMRSRRLYFDHLEDKAVVEGKDMS